MSEIKRSASARVTVTLEISIDDKWGGDCSISQVHEQAAESAVGLIRNLVEKDMGARLRVSIIGTPKVHAIIVTRESP